MSSTTHLNCSDLSHASPRFPCSVPLCGDSAYPLSDGQPVQIVCCGFQWEGTARDTGQKRVWYSGAGSYRWEADVALGMPVRVGAEAGLADDLAELEAMENEARDIERLHRGPDGAAYINALHDLGKRLNAMSGCPA